MRSDCDTPESVAAAVKHAAEAGDSKADVTESPAEQEAGPRLRLVVGACRGTWLDISVQNDFELVSWTAQLPTRADAADEANVNEIAVTERLAAIGCNPSEWQEQLEQPFGILDHHPAEEQMPQRRSLHIWRL